MAFCDGCFYKKSKDGLFVECRLSWEKSGDDPSLLPKVKDARYSHLFGFPHNFIPELGTKCGLFTRGRKNSGQFIHTKTPYNSIFSRFPEDTVDEIELMEKKEREHDEAKSG